MKGVFRKLLLAACLIASMVIPVYANAPPSVETEGATQIGFLAVLIFLVRIFGGILLTYFCELLVSFGFWLDRRNDRLVLWTNLVSQILMWLAYILLCGLFRLEHIWVVVILEVLVYAGEFLVYWRKMHEVSWIKCLLYTVVANTASLLFGLLIL